MNAPLNARPVPSPLAGEGQGGGKDEGRGSVIPPSLTLPRKGGEGNEAGAVVAFWREAGPKMWFAKDEKFDQEFRERFLDQYEKAALGELFGWLGSPTGAFGLVLLLDQFPRNAFRDTPRMYATDSLARGVADAMITLGHDQAIEPELRVFCYLPFGHSESLADQKRAVALVRPLGDEVLKHAQHHHDIIARFGRFPHRTPILGREMREEEQRYLDEGGYRG